MRVPLRHQKAAAVLGNLGVFLAFLLDEDVLFVL